MAELELSCVTKEGYISSRCYIECWDRFARCYGAAPRHGQRVPKQIPPFPTLPLHQATPTDWLHGPTRELLQSLRITMVRNETVAIAPEPTNNMTP